MPSSPAKPPPADGPPDVRAFEERLTPSIGGRIAAVGIGASLGLIALPIASYLGFIIGAAIGIGIAVTLLARTSAPVWVSATRLQAGRASIDRSNLGPVELLTKEQMADLRGRSINARAYHCQRAWIPAGVRVEIADADDPTPYWLISSRRPGALAEALRSPAG